METKTKYSVKTIALYDLCANNELLIFSTIHHIIILLFNYYSIIHLEFLKQKLTKFYINFELIQYNMEVCQVITFFTVFFIFYFSKPMSEKNEKKDNSIVGIMTTSFVTKISIISYQYYLNKDKYIEYSTEESESFGLFYYFMIISYSIRIIIFLCILAIIIVATIITCCEKCRKKAIEWSKNYRLTITEEKYNNGSADV